MRIQYIAAGGIAGAGFGLAGFACGPIVGIGTTIGGAIVGMGVIVIGTTIRSVTLGISRNTYEQVYSTLKKVNSAFDKNIKELIDDDIRTISMIPMIPLIPLIPIIHVITMIPMIPLIYMTRILKEVTHISTNVTILSMEIFLGASLVAMNVHPTSGNLNAELVRLASIMLSTTGIAMMLLGSRFHDRKSI